MGRKVEDEGKEGKGGREGGRTKGWRIVRRKARRKNYGAYVLKNYGYSSGRNVE